MDLKEIQSLIKFVSKSGVNEVKLELEDFKITIKTGGSGSETTIVHQAPMAMPQMPVTAPVVAQEAKAEVEEDSNYITITSPIIGTFYRKSSPDKPNFVEVGDSVHADSVVCMVDICGTRVFANREPTDFDEADLSNVMGAEEIVIDVHLGAGSAEATGWGCDLSAEYVHINADYHT